MKNTTVAGITYSKPTVVLLQETGIGIAEIAARTCYDSFESSENECIKHFDPIVDDDLEIYQINHIKHSNLLDTLSWTYFHHSILEHANLSFLIRGTSRGVLQEHARHRIQAISVRSTRYTMSSIINIFIASMYSTKGFEFFCTNIKKLNMFVVTDETEDLEVEQLYFKLKHQLKIIGQKEFLDLSMSKSAKEHTVWLSDVEADDLLLALNTSKAKRNVGDNFKWCVTDNWKVDMIVTFNLRSLKNYFTLRDSGAAFFGIQWLAQAMKEVTPQKYLDLIVKGN